MGHDRIEWPQGTQVAKCPQGMHAKPFSASKQITQGLANTGSFAEFGFAAAEVADFDCFLSSSLLVVAEGEIDPIEDVVSFVPVCDDVVVSISVVLPAVLGCGGGMFVAAVAAAGCSRARASKRTNNNIYSSEKCGYHPSYLLVPCWHCLVSLLFFYLV